MGRFVGLKVVLWSAVAVLSVVVYRMDQWSKEAPESIDTGVECDLEQSQTDLVNFVPKARLDMSRVRIHMS